MHPEPRTDAPPVRGLGRPFANLFTASLASNLGDGIVRTLVPLLAARLTDDPFLIGLVAAFAMLPWLLFAIPSGIVVDRIDRRAALAIAQAVRVVLSVLLFVLALTDRLDIVWLLGVVFVYGVFETLYDGASRAIPPSIVPAAVLPRANGRLEAGEQITQQFLAGPLTSLLFAVSVLIPIGAPAVCFLIAGVLALLLPRAASGRQHVVADEPRVPWHRQFADGWRFITGSHMLVTLWIVSTIGGLACSFALASWVLYLLGPLGLPEALFGFAALSGVAGALVGAALAHRLQARFGLGVAMAAANVVIGLALLVAGIPNLWVVLAANAVLSLAITVWNILVMSLRQSMIPGRLLGRVHGTWRTLLWGAMPLGSLLGGLVARVDLALPFLIGGAVSIVVAVAAWRFLASLPEPEAARAAMEASEAENAPVE